MTTLRQFEDWGDVDNDTRRGFPGNSLPTDTTEDDTIREEQALATIAQALAVLEEIRNHRAAAKRAAFEQVRRQVRAIEEKHQRRQSRTEHERRMAAPLNGNQGFSLLKR